MKTKTNYYENQLKRVHVPEGHTPSININHQTNWMDINDESAPVLIEYLKKFLPKQELYYYMVHHYHRHGDSKYIITSTKPGLDNFISDDTEMDDNMKAIIDLLGIEYEENADEWISVDRHFGEIPELNIDGEGYPACKKYKGEAVLPNEEGNCSLCGGDCTEQ